MNAKIQSVMFAVYEAMRQEEPMSQDEVITIATQYGKSYGLSRQEAFKILNTRIIDFLPLKPMTKKEIVKDAMIRS